MHTLILLIFQKQVTNILYISIKIPREMYFKYLMILFMLFFLMCFVRCVRCTWNSHFSHNEIIIILMKSNVSMRRKKRSACKTKMG